MSRRLKTTLTVRGWTFLAFIAILLLGGFLLKEAALVQTALICLVLLVVALPINRLNLIGLHVSREHPSHVFAGSRFSVTIRLGNSKSRLPSYQVETDDRFVSPLGKPFGCRYLPPDGKLDAHFESIMHERGIDRAYSISIASQFPGGFWRSQSFVRLRAKQTVYPRPILPYNVQQSVFSLRETGDDEVWSPRPNFEGDYLGIRDFVAGDPLKFIHWSASARTQRLVTREFDFRLPSRYSIIFHSYSPAGMFSSPDAFDAALEMLCGLLLHCREIRVPFDCTADFLNWEKRDLTDSHDLTTILTELAGAVRPATTSLEVLMHRVQSFVAEGKTVIISDCPVRHWKDKIASSSNELLCLSVAEMRKSYRWRSTR